MRNLLHLNFQARVVNSDLDLNRVETTTPITGTQMRKAILRSLLRGSTLMKRSKKRDFFLTRNGRIKLIILRNGNRGLCQSLEQSTTYRRLSSAKQTSVIVCEGEKTADAYINKNLLPVTTWSGGAKAVLKNDWDPLLDFQTIILFPDNDA
jgi:hypothetical protein